MACLNLVFLTMVEPNVDPEITRVIIGAFFDCYNQLGLGFLESVYEAGLELILIEAGLEVRRQEKITVWFRGREIGHFRADLVVNNIVLVEIKRAKRLHSRHKAQLINALKATEMEIGLLFNFGPKPQFKRILLTNDRKPHLSKGVPTVQPAPIRAV